MKPHRVHVVKTRNRPKAARAVPRCRRAKREPSQCRTSAYIETMIAGMRVLHNANVAHGDLKPENLLKSKARLALWQKEGIRCPDTTV